MLLKRIYNWDAPDSEWKDRKRKCENCSGRGVVVNDTFDGVDPCPECINGIIADRIPPLLHVELKHTGTHPEQNFSTGLVYAAQKEGWLKLLDDKIVLDVKPEPITYTIKRKPGRYCCHCGESLPGMPDDMTGEIARQHVEENHLGEKSPDSANPSGYCMINAFECVLSAAVHNKYRGAKSI